MMRDKVSGTEFKARTDEGTRVPGETSAVKACRGSDFFRWIRPSQRRICVSAEALAWSLFFCSGGVGLHPHFFVFRDETVSV